MVLSNSDTATLATDTLTTAITNCVQATGSVCTLSVGAGRFANCGPARSAAIE